MRTKRLTIKQRKEIFVNLVEIQDAGTMTNADSIRHIGEQYAIDENQVRQIVDEGIEKDWLESAESAV